MAQRQILLPPVAVWRLTASRRPQVTEPSTVTVNVLPSSVVLLNAGITNTNIGASAVLVAAPGAGVSIVLYQAEVVTDNTTDTPYIATSDYGGSPTSAKIFAASNGGYPSRRNWNVDGDGLILPANIGITVYSAPSSGNVCSAGVTYSLLSA